MDRGLFVASSAASNLMDRQAVVAQNLANVSTTGFKKIFDRLVTVPVNDSRARLDGGRAYAVALTPGVDARPGAMVTTGNALDVALTPGNYLAVSVGPGAEAYTRRGDLLTDAEGVLRLPTGQAVAGQDGGELAIPAGFAGAIGVDGTVWAQDPTNPTNKQEIGKLKVVQGAGVSLRNDGLYDVATAIPAENGVTVLFSQHIEQSNVSAADALAEMLETSRLYELNTKMIATFNTVDQQGVGLLSNWQ